MRLTDEQLLAHVHALELRDGSTLCLSLPPTFSRDDYDRAVEVAQQVGDACRRAGISVGPTLLVLRDDEVLRALTVAELRALAARVLDVLPEAELREIASHLDMLLRRRLTPPTGVARR